MTTPSFTKAGAKATTPAKLDKTVFGSVPISHKILGMAYQAYLANGRANLAVTKKRGEVSGGGKKPWRQKGTGRARFGSSRNPIWRGGGIAFGPTGNENYKQKLSLSTKRQAIRDALSLSAASGKVAVIEDLAITSGKTADAKKLLNKLEITGSVLIVSNQKSKQNIQAFANIANVKLIQPGYLNVFDVVNADTILLTQAAVADTETWLKEASK